ncbi:MFS transporter [Pseudonocardia spinosispora]|uniref:MFS transporter n=1 Tax=Pseudonocardia spinosispora TaxID=103441 RepID=UPI0003FD9C23|nr:MFS transporter [Pseudonocardia spinosispora]
MARLEPSTDTPTNPDKVTPRQRTAFISAFGGWLLDGYNAGIFGLVLSPALIELLPHSGYTPDAGNIAFFGELGVAVFLFGWGCSFLWGPIADRFGRVPALMASILVYAIFTFAAGFSQNVWQLGVFRLLAAIGIGGEWSLAGTFVAESMPERRRAFFGGLLHSGTYWGFLLGALVNLAVGSLLGWRWMFFLGVLPALFVLYIRTQVHQDTERWKEAAREPSRGFWSYLRDVLRPPYRTRSLTNAALVTIGLLGFWASSQYLPTAIKALAIDSGYSPGAATALGSIGVAVLSLLTALACILAPSLCNRFGRRKTLGILFVMMIIGISGGYAWAYPQQNLPLFFLFVVVMGIGGADFAVFTIWLPEQYPTALRASGFAFSTTMSRFVAAIGTFGIGYGISAGGIALPLALTAVPFLLAFVLLRFSPETRDQVLPD